MELIKEKEARHRQQMDDLDKKIKEQEDYMQRKHKEKMHLEWEQDERKAVQEAELDAAKEEIQQCHVEKLIRLQASLKAVEENKAESDAREQKADSGGKEGTRDVRGANPNAGDV